MERDGESGEGGTMPGVRREGEEGQARGHTEVNTGACIVCGERAGSVAILRIAPRRFCFRSRCPDRFLPPHTPLLFRLFRESRSSLVLERERRVCQPIKGTGVYPRLVPPLSFRSLARSLRFALSSRATKFSSSAAGIFISFIRLAAAFSLHAIFLKIFLKHTSLLVCNFFSSDVRRITGATREGRRGFISS